MIASGLGNGVIIPIREWVQIAVGRLSERSFFSSSGAAQKVRDLAKHVAESRLACRSTRLKEAVGADHDGLALLFYATAWLRFM